MRIECDGPGSEGERQDHRAADAEGAGEPAAAGQVGGGAAYTHPTQDTNQAPAGTDPWTKTAGGQTASYTTVYYPADENGGAFYVVYDSSGAYVDGGTGTPPADDTVGTTTQTTDGDQAIFPSDTTNSNTDDNKDASNDKDGDGIPDDQDDTDDRDKDGDGQPDAPATTDSNDESTDTAPAETNTAPSTNGTPNPDSTHVDPHARQQWLTSTPFGQAEIKATLKSLAQSKTGGYGDPEQVGINPFARAAFYNSPLFSHSSQPIKAGPGNVDYVDQVSKNVVIDKRQLDAIAIRAGGAVAGPEVGKKPANPNGQTNPVVPVVPIVGGGTAAKAVFSTTAIQLTAKLSVVKVTAASVHT